MTTSTYMAALAALDEAPREEVEPGIYFAAG